MRRTVIPLRRRERPFGYGLFLGFFRAGFGILGFFGYVFIFGAFVLGGFFMPLDMAFAWFGGMFVIVLLAGYLTYDGWRVRRRNERKQNAGTTEPSRTSHQRSASHR